MLILSPIVLLISLYTGIMFGLIFLLFTTFPSVFQGVYGFDAGTSGLAYLGLRLGMFLGLILFSVVSDKLLGQTQGGVAPQPEQASYLDEVACSYPPIWVLRVWLERTLPHTLDSANIWDFHYWLWLFIRRHPRPDLSRRRFGAAAAASEPPRPNPFWRLSRSYCRASV
jgi:hypothetical protein